MINRFIKWTFNAKIRLSFYETLEYLLSCDLQLMDAFLQMREIMSDFGRKKPPPVIILTDFIEHLRQEGNIDNALKKWLPSDEATILSSAFSTNNNIHGLQSAKRLVESKAEIRTLIFNSLAYPIVVILFFVIMLIIISYDLIPQLTKFSSPESWQGSIKFLYHLSNFLINDGVIVLAIIIMLMIATVYSIPNGTGSFRTMLDKLPPWSIYRALQGASFMLNMASLQNANISTLQSLQQLLRFSSPWLTERINATIFQIEHGDGLGKALKETGYNFPSKDTVNQLYLLTLYGKSSSIIESMGKRWLKDTTSEVKKATSLVTVIFLLLNVSFILLIISGFSQISSTISFIQ